jgi:RNA polymerase sigma-70 factor (ECF subfamily)
MMAPSIEHLDDSAVLRRIATGDGLAAFEFVRRYEHRLIVPVAERILGNSADAQEVVSTLLMRLLAFERYSTDGSWPPSKVGEWLTTVVTRLALDAKRTRDAEWSRRRRQKDWFDRASMPGEEAEFHELRHRVLDALRALPQQEREAIVLFDLEDLPVAAACEKMSVSRATLYRYRSQGLNRLRDSATLRHLFMDDELPLSGRA